MYREHEAFTKPPDENSSIWRYMDFTKFVSLLEEKALFFTRADNFEDLFEGLNPHLNKLLKSCNLDQRYNAITNLRREIELYKQNREEINISCWHMNNTESYAMWKIYSTVNQGVAIQSTYSSLCKSLHREEKEVYIGVVKYIDYKTEYKPVGSIFYPFLNKRKQFEYEQELRAIVWLPGDSKGVNCKVDLDVLIHKVYISPSASEWFINLVKKVMYKYRIIKPIEYSCLNERPIY